MINFRLATMEDTPAIHRLMWDVYESLPDKNIFVPDSYEWVCEHIEEKGFILVATTPDDSIISYFLIRYPHLAEDNLGYDVNLPEHELLKVVLMDSCVVAPAYRGRHLQRRLFQLAEKYIDDSLYTYLMGTAAPDNYASCRSFEKSGYTCVLTKEKYEGKLRNIYLKKLTSAR